MAETVPIEVPVEWVSEVYSLFADLAARKYGASADQVPSSAAPAGPPAQLDTALVERMYRDSLKPHKQLMLYLAEHPEQWLSTVQIATALQLEKGPKALAGMLGAFSRRSKNRYHGLAPWESRWIAEAEHSEHRMTQAVADVLMALATAERAAAEERHNAKVVKLPDGSMR
jgi:hypothetical protein